MRILHVDAFVTPEAFSGNPAAVCIEPPRDDPAWMQAVAAQMNLSETSFVKARADGRFDLRWFTPRAEVDLCGHATLAAAQALWDEGVVDGAVETLRFDTASGELVVERDAEGRMALALPACPALGDISAAEHNALEDSLSKALGARPLRVERNRFDLLVEYATAEDVQRIRPDWSLLERIETRGVIVTAPGVGSIDIVSRAFFPRLGVPEDPFCGSAHAFLAPYWSPRLGTRPLHATQYSQRGGVAEIWLEGERVVLRGRARTVLRGVLEACAL